MAAALVHEYSYEARQLGTFRIAAAFVFGRVLSLVEACVFDLLDGNMLDGDRNVVTLKTSHAGEVQ